MTHFYHKIISEAYFYVGSGDLNGEVIRKERAVVLGEAE